MREFVVRGGHAKPLWAGHPWVHAEGLQESDATSESDGDVGLVRDRAGRVIGWGLVSDPSALRLRLLAWGEADATADDLLAERIDRACAWRRTLFPRPARTNAYRLVHAEGDGLPGLVVDRYGDVLVVQFATAPMHRRRDALARRLLEASGASSLLARPSGYEAEEGIDPDRVAYEAGRVVPATIRVVEEGMVLEVEPRHGQKTGHYADQRENRVRVAEVAGGRRVLDLYAGTGGFSVQALRHGAASSLAVEVSARATATMARTARLNAVSPGLEIRTADVRQTLRELKDAGTAFDIVVCDPPNFFPRRGGHGHAPKAYRDLNVQALTRIEKGGMLATFTCSAKLPQEHFLELIRSCARECRRTLRVVRELSAGPDHPFPAAAPESRYLTGLLVAVDA